MLAKGKIYVTKEKLAELFCLPEGVELMAVRVKESDEAFEFLVMSAEETVATKKGVPMSQLRRTSVETLEQFKHGKNTGGIIATGQTMLVDLRPRETILTQKEIGELLKLVEQVQLRQGESMSINVVLNEEPKEKKDVKDLFKDVLKSSGI